MKYQPEPERLTPAARLGITGLPNLTNTMIRGGMYVLIAEMPPARFPLLAASLGAAVESHLFCNVIAATNPAQFIERVESYGTFNATELIEADRMNMLVLQDEVPKKMFRLGADVFVSELEQFEIPEDSFLIFDQADALLSLHDASVANDQVDILRRWFERHRVTALLVFTRVTEAHSNTINSLMDSLNGVARLGGERDGLELTFDYWQSLEGTIAARNYRLTRIEGGLYETSDRVVAPDSAVEERESDRDLTGDDTQPHYFYMNPDLDQLAAHVAGVWQRHATLVGIMHASRNNRTATTILSYERDTNLRQLAETVHMLRSSLGRRARIVVHEKGASLRYLNEALLLRLGLNLVIHRDVPNGRLPLLLESLNGQNFNRDVDINFEAALASVLPTRLRGYLAPLRFAREVGATLAQGHLLNIPSALIIGTPLAMVSMTELISTAGLSRPGDLISADNEHCYLFLNACSQSTILVALERILKKRVDQVFGDVRFLARNEEISTEISGLVHRAEKGNLPDYSTLVVATEEIIAVAAPVLTVTGALDNDPVFPSAAPVPVIDTEPGITVLPEKVIAASVVPKSIQSSPPASADSTVLPASRGPVRQSTVPAKPTGVDAANAVFVTALGNEPQFTFDAAVVQQAARNREVPRAKRSNGATDSGSVLTASRGAIASTNALSDEQQVTARV